MDKTLEQLMDLDKSALINEAKNEIGFKFCEKSTKEKIAKALVKFREMSQKDLAEPTGKMSGVLAKKNHHILQNQIDIKIKEGDDLGKIPDRFEAALKSEGVI